MRRWPAYLLLLCALVSARCSMCSGPGPREAKKPAPRRPADPAPRPAPRGKDKKMVEQTTYPVFLANTLRSSAVAVGSKSKGGIVWSKAHGLSGNELPRYLLLWSGRVLVETPARLVLFSHDGKRQWEREKHRGAFAAVGSDELLHYQNKKEGLDLLEINNTLKLDNGKLPPTASDAFALRFYAPHGKGYLVVGEIDTGSTIQVHARHHEPGQMYAVWERDCNGSLSLPPILDAAAKQVLLSTSLKVRRVSARNGKKEPGWDFTIFQPQNWSADGRGNLTEQQEPADAATRGDGLYRAARLVDDAGDNPLSATPLPLELRRRALVNLQATLILAPAGAAPADGLDERQALQLRSSAATVLLALIAAAGDSDEERALQADALAAYQRALEAESHPVLRDSMIFNLHTHKGSLTAAGRQASDRYMRELAPLSPPYGAWFAGDARTLNVTWTSGRGSEGFYTGTVELLRRQGFEIGDGDRGGPCMCTKAFPDRDGGEVQVRVKVVENDHSIFADMDEPEVHLVGYDGHADIGRNIPASLRDAPDGVGDKMIFYGLCAGKDTLSRVRERYPEAQLLTTFTSSYFTVEKVDGDKRMNASENFNVLMVLLEDICQRRPWTVINRHIRDRAILYRYHHVMPGGTNYISPAHTLIRRRVLDSDHDGQADVLDRLVSFNLFAVDGSTDREFSPRPPRRPWHTLDGSAVHLAAMTLDTAVGYNQVTQRYKKGRLVGAGYRQAPAGDEVPVTFESARLDGEQVQLMKVSHLFAHMSVEALRAVAAFQLIQSVELRDELTLQDRRIMGLTCAAFTLVYGDASRRRVRRIWAGLLELFGLPGDIPYQPLHDLLWDEHHHDSGSHAILRRWKRQIPEASLEALRT